MLTLAVFLLAVYGLANAATLKAGQWLFGVPKARRGLGRIPYAGDLFYCPPCMSFWIGAAFSAWLVSPSSALTGVWWKAAILDGLAASAASWLLHLAAETMARRLGEGYGD